MITTYRDIYLHHAETPKLNEDVEQELWQTKMLKGWEQVLNQGKVGALDNRTRFD